VLNGGLMGAKGGNTAHPRGSGTFALSPNFSSKLPSVFFRLSQFFASSLYFLYCVKHGAIENLNIAFSW